MDKDDKTAQPAKQPKRGLRACVQCRKLKKTCEPGPNGTDCTRCTAAGSSCIYDRPASSVVDDAGLDRLSSIEAHLATLERRLDTIVTSISTISNNIENLSKTSNWAPSPAASRPITHASPAASGSPFASHPVFTSANPPVAAASSSTSADIKPPIRSASLSTSADSPLLALASLATDSPTAGVDRFATRLYAPIQALADAETQLQAPSEIVPDASVISVAAIPSTEEARPKKRSRVAGGGAAASAKGLPGSQDVVGRGIVEDRHARMLVALWMKEMINFCAIFDPTMSYNDFRKNPLLFDAIVYTAMRAEGGVSVPKKELILVAEQMRETAKNLIFDSSPPLEVIQALLVMAAWHEEPYVMSGFALRLALSTRLDTALEQLHEHGLEKTDDKARRLTSCFRTFCFLVFLEFKHSRSTGRPLLLPEQDIDSLEAKIDILLNLPCAIPSDARMIANFHLTYLERQIIHASRMTSDLATQVAVIHDMRARLMAWYEQFDSSLAIHHPDPADWSRRSHLRQLQEATVFLPANVLKHRLLEPNVSMEVTQISNDALVAALATIRTVLQSAAYSASVKYSGYLMRVDLSFASLLLLKLASLFPNLVTSDEVVNDVSQIANLLAVCSGSQRFATTIRFAVSQFLAKSRDEPTPDATSANYGLSEADFNALLAGGGAGPSGTQTPGLTALLPGETEIDWSALPNALLGGGSDVLSYDWLTNGAVNDGGWWGTTDNGGA